MSGSDYTLTPNLGLFKPTYNGDEEQWGNHINSNSDILDGALAGGGPFLPIAGGTVTANVEALRASFGTQSGNPALFDGSKALFVKANPTFSGTAWCQSFHADTNGVGTTTTTGQPQWNLFNTVDGVHATAVNSIANLASYYTLQGSSGSRTNMQFSMVVSGNTNDAAGSGNYFQGFSGGIVVDGTIGGTSASVRGGQAFGSNITATATVNGKYLNQICGLEIDVALQAGSSAWSKGGITVNLQNADAVESANPSAAYTVGLTSDSPGSPGWTYGFVFGSGGSWWPINTTTGILIYADPNPFPGGRGLQAKSGIDFSAVAFIDSAYKSTGFRVDGTGHLTSIGLGFGSTAVSTATDLSKHIDLYGGVAGINVQSGGLTNYNALGGGAHMFNVGGTAIAYIGGSGIQSASGGLHFGAQGAATYNDFTKHIEIYNGSGFTVTGAGLNYVISNAHNFYTGSSNRFIITTTGLGFNGTAAVAKPTGVPVTIAAVHAALVSYGLIAP